MANYFLKSDDDSKAYRIDYTMDDTGNSSVSCYCTGNGVTLPSGDVVASVDSRVVISDVLVDVLLGNVSPAVVEDYRRIAAVVASSASWE